MPKPAARASRAPAHSPTAPAEELSAKTFLAVPVAATVGIGLHLAVRKNDPEPDTTSWLIFLGSIMGASLLMAVGQLFWNRLRRWMAHMCPIMAAALGLFCIWELITSGFRLLPLP